jgi:hypothetical protein
MKSHLKGRCFSNADEVTDSDSRSRGHYGVSKNYTADGKHVHSCQRTTLWGQCNLELTPSVHNSYPLSEFSEQTSCVYTHIKHAHTFFSTLFSKADFLHYSFIWSQSIRCKSGWLCKGQSVLFKSDISTTVKRLLIGKYSCKYCIRYAVNMWITDGWMLSYKCSSCWNNTPKSRNFTVICESQFVSLCYHVQ